METNLQLPQKLFAQPVRYDIPEFQRRYVWKQDEQWEPLWEDVEKLSQTIIEDGDTDAHFMGAVVFQQKNVPSGTIERRIVVDGQQRLTTIQLLIDAIQEVLEEREHTNPAKRLASLVINQEEFRDNNPDHAFKVWPTAVDREAFRHAMSNELYSATYSSSRIVEAHEYFKGQTVQWLDRFDRDAEARNEAAGALEKAVRTKLELVVIDLGASDDPHVIFETLNARGTPLLQSDMVKNKILHESNAQVEDDSGFSEETKRLWPFDEDWWAQEVGRGLQRRPRIDAYLNHWLTLRNESETKPYDEFREFEKLVETRTNVGDTIRDVSKDIGDIGRIYRDVEQMTRKDIGSFLARRNVMNVGVVTPLLLWLLSSDVPGEPLRDCLKVLESFLVRRVICGYSARSYGELFVGAIARLAPLPSSNVYGALVEFFGEQTAQAAVWPTDHELLERFTTAPLYLWLTRGRLRMVLAGIEEQLRTNKAEHHQVPYDLQIEHVMPQAWKQHWPLSDAENEDEAFDHRNRMIHTIGNLTLVNQRLNPALSNGSWSDKRKELANHSVLFLNKHLVNEGPEVWDESEIEKRAESLHIAAVQVWPYWKDLQQLS